MTFDADTALVPVIGSDPPRWTGTVPETWSVGEGPNGGFMAALAARASGELTGLPLRSLTVHYLARPAYEAIEVSAETVREGRAASFLRLAMTQGERTVVTGVAVCGAWDGDAPAFADLTPPTLPGPDACVQVDPQRTGVPPLISRYDMRIAERPADARPGRVEGWIRTAEPRPLDDVAVAAITDAFIPPAIFRAGTPVSVPTLELTIHFRGAPPAGEHPFVASSFVTRLAAGGFCEVDGDVWSEDGRLLAQARQLALVRGRR